MNQMQKGFTLIELMIVVAIVAILAAIAIPAYQDYITKAQFTESQTVSDSMKTPIQDFYSQTGTCPTIGKNGLAKTSASYGGKYVATATVVTPGTSTIGTPICDVKVTFKAASVSKPLISKVVLFQGSDNGGSYSWRCSSTGATGIADKYLPQTCRVTQ